MTGLSLLLAPRLAVALLAAEPQVPAAPADPVSPAPAAASGQADAPITVTTRLAPDPSHVGDLLTLEVTAAFARGYSVNLPIGVKLDPLHLVDVTEGEPEATGEGLRKTFSIRLQHFAPGAAQIPGFALTYVDPHGAIQTAAVPPVAFTVEALLANEGEPEAKPDDPPISIEYPNTLAETIVYSVLGTLAGALLLWFALRRLLGRRRPVVVVPSIPPHLVAFEALDELERSPLLTEGRVQDYYVQLTEIGKGYVERRFGLDALDRTTDEIRRALLREPGRVAPLGADDIVGFLQRSDLVKFARMRPDDDEARDALGFVRDIVERSMPVAAGAAANTANAANAPGAGADPAGPATPTRAATPTDAPSSNAGKEAS